MKVVFIIVAICLVLLIPVGLFVFLESTDFLPPGEVALSYQDSTRNIQVVLTPEEASQIRAIFDWKFFNHGVGGCLFDDGICISIGGEKYLIAADGCAIAKDAKSGNCFEFSQDEYAVIQSFFDKYCGKTIIS